MGEVGEHSRERRGQPDDENGEDQPLFDPHAFWRERKHGLSPQPIINGAEIGKGDEVGQKRGEGLKDGLRVVDIDAANNRIIVGASTSLYKHKLYITDCNIVDVNELLTADDITIKIRGIGVNPQQPVSIESWDNGYIIHTPDAAFAPAKGQPLVFYRNNRVIGGGIVVGFN